MIRTTLCTSPRCRAIGQHYDDCDADDCRGCLPRTARPPARLCTGCGRQLARDIAASAVLHGELAERLTGGTGDGARGPNVPGSRQPDDRPIAARTQIRLALMTWCRIVCEERGVGTPVRVAVQDRPWGFIGPMPVVRTPDDSIEGAAALLGRHVGWLIEHQAAGECAADFAETAHGRPRRVAYPSGARTFDVAACPRDTDGVPCEGVIRAILRRTDSLLPSELVCDVDDTHRWASTQWVKLGRQLLGVA